MMDIFFIFLGLMFILLALATYMIPTIVAVIREAPDIGLIVVVNILAGWLMLGWFVALALALRNAPIKELLYRNRPTVQMYLDPPILDYPPTYP
jgi:hypothetical protein